MLTATGTSSEVIEHRTVALNKPLVILSLILSTALSALDATIVSTTMPAIAGALGGLPLYSLVIAGPLLTATTTVPLFGKLLDMYGRKPVFIFGSLVFTVSSVLCGLAWDMPSLIAFRVLQGLGAGAIVPASLTLIGDIFSVEERAKMQGVFGSVWGISSIAGPLVGGTIVQFVNWRWIFFINLPVGVLAIALVAFYLREHASHERQKLDVAGTVALTLGVGSLLLGLQWGGRGGGWFTPDMLLFASGTVLLLTLFIMFERRAPAPILALGLLSRPIIAVPCMTGLLSGGVLIGMAAFVPLLVQGAWGRTPIEAGLAVAPLSIGWPLASSRTGFLVRRFGYRNVVRAGLALLAMGSASLLLVGLPFISANVVLRTWVLLGAALITGAGMGASATAMLIAVQISVPWSERGISTASVQFFRNMGQALGASALGVLLTVTLAPALASPAVRTLANNIPSITGKAGSDPSLGPVNALFDLTVRESLSLPLRTALSDVLQSSLWWVFLGMLVFALLAAFFGLRFPTGVNEQA